MPDDYAYYRAALKGEKPAIHPDDPQPGRYWTRTVKNGPRLPVAIWRDSAGAILALVGFEGSAKLDDAERVWAWCAERPLSEDDYQETFTDGRFPSDLPAEALPPPPPPPSKISDPMPPTPTEPAPAGSNNPPADDDFDVLAAQLAAVQKNLATLKAIRTDTDAELAQGYRARLLEIGKKMDARRDSLKRPHLEAGRAIDNRWNPSIKDAQRLADDLRKRLATYNTDKARAEEARRREEEAAAAAAAPPPAADDEGEASLPLEAPPPAPAPKAPQQQRGSYGKAAVVKDIAVIKEIDYAAAYQRFAENEEVKALLFKLAKKVIDAGGTVPGVVTEMQKDVR